MRHVLKWFSHLIGWQRAVANPLDAMPDFQDFKYMIAIEPSGSHVNAWGKLREAERRHAMYKWVEQRNDPAKAQHRVLLNDSVSAFLLTFEASIQFLKDQFKRSCPTQKFDAWFAQQSQNDVHVKGLRTLRHLEAHVEVKPPPRTVHVDITASFGGRKSGNGIRECIWRLPPITSADLGKLHKHTPLADTDLNDWNTLVVNSDAGTICANGLDRLKQVLEAAEKVV